MFGEKLIAQLGLDSSEFDSGVNKAAQSVGRLEGGLKKIGVAAAAAAFVGFFKGVVERGAELQDVSEQLGITTDALQALEYSAKQAGVSGDQMRTVYEKLTVAGADAGNQTSASAKALEALGISAKDFAAASPDQKLEMVAKASANAADKQAAFASVADLVGAKVAPKLTGVLNDLAENGLGGVIGKAREAGQVMDSETIKRFDEIGDRVSMLKTRLETFGSKLLQGVFDFVDGLGVIAAQVANTIDGIPNEYSGLETVADRVTVAVEKTNVALLGTKATSEDLKRLQEARDKLTEKELTDRERENLWLEKIVKAANEKGKYQKDSKEALALETEIIGYQQKMLDQQVATQKKAAEERKKAAEDEEKFAIRQMEAAREQMTHADRKKSYLLEEKLIKGEIAALDEDDPKRIELQNRLLDVQTKIRSEGKAVQSEQNELAKLLLIPEAQRTEVQKEQIRLLEGQTTVQKQQEELTRLQSGLIAGVLTDAEKSRLNVLLGQVEAAKAQTEELRKQAEIVGTITRKGKTYDAQSTENLKFVEEQLRKQFTTLDNQRNAGGNDPMWYELKSQLEQVRAELNKRIQFQTTLTGMGTDYTKRLYSPDEYNRLFDLVNGGVPEQKKTNDLLEDIQQRIKNVLPKQ